MIFVARVRQAIMGVTIDVAWSLFKFAARHSVSGTPILVQEFTQEGSTDRRIQDLRESRWVRYQRGPRLVVSRDGVVLDVAPPISDGFGTHQPGRLVVQRPGDQTAAPEISAKQKIMNAIFSVAWRTMMIGARYSLDGTTIQVSDWVAPDGTRTRSLMDGRRDYRRSRMPKFFAPRVSILRGDHRETYPPTDERGQPLDRSLIPEPPKPTVVTRYRRLDGTVVHYESWRPDDR